MGSPTRLLQKVAPKAHAELLHPHARGLGHHEMPELVCQDEEPGSRPLATSNADDV